MGDRPIGRMGNIMMQSKIISCAGALALAVLVFCAPNGWSQTLQVIYNFGGPGNGSSLPPANPYAGIVFDGQGNLYGTTENGGLVYTPCNGCGTVYELSPNGSGGWNESTLYAFEPFSDGGLPTAPVVLDRFANIYGMTNCPQDCFYGGGGEVFKLAHGSWTISDLYSAWEYSGCTPGYDYGTGGMVLCSVAFDHSSHLYGSTVIGGNMGSDCNKGCGQVFVLGQISVLSWYYIVVHDFADAGSDGRFPQGLLNFDADNNIYGTTGAGGSANHGTVYMLTPNRDREGWSETLLYSFQGGTSDGANPIAGVVLDAAGNVYGTTSEGGSAGLGTVYMLTPSNGAWTETLLYSFQGGGDASTPNSSLSFDAAGNLYGTAGGGADNQGTIFKLTPSGGHWTESVVHTFTGGADGGQPFGGVTIDSSGNLYGTASIGGTYGQTGGVAFEITP